MSKFKRNQAAFDAFRKNTPYRDTPFEASTGKLNSDGTINPNPAVGLDPGYVWVRREGDRAETRALAGKVRTDIANIPVVVAQDNLTGELTVMDVRADAAVLRFGAYAQSMYAQPQGELFTTTINGRNFKPGRVRVWISSTLKVNAEAFWYNNTAQARVLWEPSDSNVLDLSGNVPAAVGGINYQRWVVIALNPNATTPALVAFNGTAINAASTLLKASIADIAVTAGYTPLVAVQLRTGDTTEADITDGEWEDLRPWVVNVDYSAITGAVITNSTIDSSVIGGDTPAAGTFDALAGTIVTATGGAAYVSGAAGTNRILVFQSSGVDRWNLLVSSSAESGSNAGSNFSIGRYDDAGVFMGPVLSYIRSTGLVSFITDDTSTASVLQSVTINRTSTGTPADGIGTALGFGVETNGAGAGTKQVGSIQLSWPTNLDSGRLGRMRFLVNDFNTAREALVLGTNGSAPLIGFLGATAVARPGAYVQNYSTATRTRNAYTADNESVAYTGIDNAQAGSVYATVADLNALRVAYENLRAAVENDMQVGNQQTDDFQAYGLFA